LVQDLLGEQPVNNLFGLVFGGFIGPDCHVESTLENDVLAHLPEGVLVYGVGGVVPGEVIQRAMGLLAISVEDPQAFPLSSAPFVFLFDGFILVLDVVVSVHHHRCS